MVNKVVESGGSWDKVVDKFITLWIKVANLKAGDCVRCLWENTTIHWMQKAD